ncbi:ferredoxin [Rhodococcus phenolicus]|uniref:ferredoxin n=1 Tax=Rhodococcus phenolicus TaxID=263849 RepID=UPI00082E13E3|nr:ferredoxin [Rhodococcus phenolicus]
MPENRYVVELDQEICMGAGVCVSYAADTFAIGPGPKAELVHPVTNISDVQVAASGCPTGAITVRDSQEGPTRDGR